MQPLPLRLLLKLKESGRTATTLSAPGIWEATIFVRGFLRIRVTIALANGRAVCSPEGREAHQLCVPTPEHRALLASELTVRSCCDQGREGCA